MPRTTIATTLARREAVERLELRRATAQGIAAGRGADPRTSGHDLRALAAARARGGDVAAAHRRLLAAARLVEVQAWAMFDRLDVDAAHLQLGALGKVLAAQERQAHLLGQL